MPTYTYFCNSCVEPFEIFSTISSYKEKEKCSKCKSICSRFYEEDMLSINGSVKKSDSDLKLGDLANRNRDRMSDDHKQYLHQKHNEYKDPSFKKELPQGMSRAKPGKKTKWT